MLLQRLQVPFQVAPSHIDETMRPDENPTEMVLRLAQEKAYAVSNQFANAIIIGSDQAGYIDGHVLGKPLTYENAIKQLMLVSNRRVHFLIGLCVLNTADNTRQMALETFDVQFRELTPRMIENYLEKENALECAGSFKAEGLGVTLAEKLIGDDYTALIGLPLIRLTRMLEHVHVL